ncbi:unnamed protein product [Rotaria sordida]|uniref:PiggyBac transposable element-derived protein domain-containing protein n=1 Tax=Rotaria sordida TaxID=392033 RepID=A0A814KCV9_9BILA|nr:unnamed protein product [Rotaria sordida]CAF1212884.1 unnamed protein product [Rotaria sordida]
MDKRKRSNFNQSKYWLDDSEHFDDKSSDEDTNVNHDSEDAEIPSTLQGTSDESDDGTVEKDSGDESDENSVDTESMSDEEPPRRRAKRKPQVKPTPVKICSSKSGRQWTSKEPHKKKVPIANILRQRTGVGRPAADIQTLKEAFQLLITQEMVLLLVKETNRRAHLLLERWSEENPDEKSQWRDTDLEEMWAFIGLLLLAGVHRAKNETLDELWSMTNGRPIFRATMSKNRFKSLLQFCRFDNTTTREERLKVDKLAAIRDLWTMFLARLQICYMPGGSLTVDEQLIPTRGRCNFRQYIPSKPGKYGVKIFWCCDSDTAYPLNAEVYLGRQPGAPTAAKDKDRIRNLVKQLIHPWINTGRTITTDNYFTSAELSEDLLGVQTTLVGTIQRNKKEIPRELQPDTHRPEQSSIFCFDRQLTLVSYVPKKAHAVILLSSLHHDQTIVDEKKKKPEIILYYNNTKGGVDRMDQMVQTYSCKRKTKRWPMTFFFNIIDVGALAACIVWLTKNPQWNEKKCYRRRIFLMELGYDLIQSHLERRQHQPQALQKRVRIAMQAIGLTVATSQPNTVSTDTAKQRCHLCPRERDRKVVTHCSSCNIPCCPDHHKVICTVCSETFLR